MTDPILNTRGEDFIINVIFNSYTDLHSIKSVMRGNKNIVTGSNNMNQTHPRRHRQFYHHEHEHHQAVKIPSDNVLLSEHVSPLKMTLIDPGAPCFLVHRVLSAIRRSISSVWSESSFWTTSPGASIPRCLTFCSECPKAKKVCLSFF